ncbi:SLC13 family permease [Aggregatibacter actinomycetemcomitans]|uniref:SLC13 family permease n=1 Tax=Aggregatibacter actinomycetemcomitans TaxID=714 RepID=UPI0011D3C64F|nr:SLC13 family permease [Aggregatibacter actinomycetemcomitans]TYA24372.1 SLC13 family permease [Aggregatibacter actinomycetemcomitans]
MSQISHFFNSFQPEPWLWVVLLLIAAVILFIRNHIRMDIVAVLVMLAFSLSGILTVEEVFAGFSDPNIILIALLFIVGEGLVRTGVAYQVSEWLLKASHNSESRVLVFMMLAVAGLGAFMSSTGVVAIFIPVVLMICQQMNISPKRLMMPLSVAGLISGMLTLIATAPNLVVNAELVREAGMRLKFFDLTPIGLVILLLGIGYMLVARRWLKSGTKADNNKLDKRSISDLIHEYSLQLRAQRFVVKKGSAIIGKNLDELHLRSKYGLNVLAIERWKRFRPLFIAALGTSEVREKDILLMDISDPELDIETFCTEYNLERAEIRAQYFSEQASSIGMAELILVPNSDCIGKSTEQLRFRSKYDLNVVGIKRDGEVLDGHFVEMPYKAGDLLLVVGDWKLIQQMRSHSKDFFVLNYPSEITRAVPAQSQAPYALLSIAVMVLLMVKHRLYFANHNSHGDFILLWVSLPYPVRKNTRPVAGADYWTKGPIRRFLAYKVFNMLLIDRGGDNPQAITEQISDALQHHSLIIFPEGTRKMEDDLPLQPFNSGLYYLAKQNPQLEMVPVWISNMHNVLPKGFVVPIPLLCDLYMDEPLFYRDDENKAAFLTRAEQALLSLNVTEKGRA